VQLYHQRDFPRPAALSKSDEQDCYAADGRRRGVWLTTERPDGANVVAIDVPDGAVDEYEVTAPDDDARTFVIPAKAIPELTD
jgi:hypothetical protein